jgi:hypothetical protein
MTQQATISFNTEEALAIIMALELVAENPNISMTVHGQTYAVNLKYIKDTEALRIRLYEFHLAQKNSK